LTQLDRKVDLDIHAMLNPLRASDDFQKGLLKGETCDTSSPKMENMKTIRKCVLKLSICIRVL